MITRTMYLIGQHTHMYPDNTNDMFVGQGHAVFMGHGFTFEGQESGSVLSAAMCKLSSLPSAQKDKRSRFSQGKRSAAQLLRDHKSCE